MSRDHKATPSRLSSLSGAGVKIPLQSPRKQNQGNGLAELSSSFQLQSGKKEMGITGKVTFTPTVGTWDQLCDSPSRKGTGDGAWAARQGARATQGS